MNIFTWSHWIIFSTGSVIFIAISWRSLKDTRSHGFYRFFAWEAVLLLFLLNVGFWFHNPLAWYQLIAWTLLLFSFIPLALGIHSLRTRGNPARQRQGDPSLLAFEKTTTLVTSGVYHYIRHPLYSSLLLLTWGIFFKSPSLAAGLLAGVSTFFLVLTARADEAECRSFFGEEYAEYMKTTKMFVPHLL